MTTDPAAFRTEVLLSLQRAPWDMVPSTPASQASAGTPKEGPVRDIRGYVDYVLRNGTITDRGMIGNVGRTIGTDVVGKPVSGLEIIVRDGMIKTAFPVAVP